MENTELNTLAKALHAERKRLKLTQVQLAKILQTTQQAIGGWEAGKTLPRKEFYDRMCNLFGPHSPINNVAKKGEIVMAHNAKHTMLTGEFADTPESVHSDYAEKLARLFDKLPEDEVARAWVFGRCTSAIFSRLAPTAAPVEEPTQALLPAPRQNET
jgi:transcriptional regulator with XRE-family HTH domain